MKMKLPILIILASFSFISVVNAATKPATWKAAKPEGYTPIIWASARGVSSFMKAPEGNGHLDFLTIIYLPYNRIEFISSSTPKLDWGIGKPPFSIPTNTLEVIPQPYTNFFEEPTTTILTPPTSTPSSNTSTEARDWAFTKIEVEKAKAANPTAKFIWNVPFFNVEIPVTNLSLGLKSADSEGPYITSGSRPEVDMAIPRKMLIINNTAGTSTINNFDENTFINDGDQAVEGFDPSLSPKGSDGGTARLFIGVKPNGKELVIYCSQGATPNEAVEALLAAGVPVENQLQADGGTSATCAYNLPGQFFVEPGRTLPHLMGAFPLFGRGTVTQKGLNVRNSPNAKGKILRTLELKSPVMIYESKNGWLRISKGNEWVFAKYIKQVVN